MKSIKCNKCGAAIEINYDKLIGYCPYCGNQLHFDLNQVEEILKAREYTKQVELHESGQTQRAKFSYEKEKSAVHASKIIMLVILCVWIFSLVFFGILSMMTLDNVNFSPYQLLLIIDLIGGIVVLTKWLKR